MSRSGRLLPVGLFLVLACGSPAAPRPDGAGISATETPAEPLGRGFAVWESNRSGAWRIWTRDLADGEPQPLSPDEPGRQHCCPRISPDGRSVAFLSTTFSRPRYPEGGLEGELRLLVLEDRSVRTLAAEARSYFENRAVVWRDERALIYLDGAGATRLLDSVGGGDEELLPAPERLPGWLIDPTLRWATHNDPTFSPYDRTSRSIAPRPSLGGCQAAFSQDGRWGVWTGGAGGPVYRIELATREVAPLLEKFDPRLPEGYGYLYFPLPAHDGRLLALGASRGEHDHFQADYEIFVLETDPATLEPLGPARRLTRHPATDRYPDVWLAPSLLGDHRGEAPFRIALETGEPGTWHWELGDGRIASGPRVEPTYPEAGHYEVVARDGDRTLSARVVVAPRRAPGVLDAASRDEGRELRIRFDEQVRAQEPTFRFAGEREVSSWELAEDGRSLRLAVTPPVVAGDTLRLEGFEDRAQQPNPLPPSEVEIPAPSWPSRSRDLVFVWATGDALNLLEDRGGGPGRSVTLQPRGRARLDRHFGLLPGGGSFEAEPEIAAAVVDALRDANALTLEMTLRPGSRSSGRLLALGRVQGRPAFELHLQEGSLRLRLATAPRGPGFEQWVELFEVSAETTVQLALSYRPGRLVVYRDGEEVRRDEAVSGDFFPWKAGPFVVAGEGDLALEGIALWADALAPETIAEDARRYRAVVGLRPAVAVERLELRVEGCSRVPTLEEISPYREALAVCAHEVVAGPRRGERIRVAHWALLDGEAMPFVTGPGGRRLRLRLEPFAEQPQLESFYLSDTLEGEPEGPLLFAVDPDPGADG